MGLVGTLYLIPHSTGSIIGLLVLGELLFHTMLFLLLPRPKQLPAIDRPKKQLTEYQEFLLSRRQEKTAGREDSKGAKNEVNRE